MRIIEVDFSGVKKAGQALAQEPVPISKESPYKINTIITKHTPVVNNSATEKVLSLLECVTGGPDQWSALCPAHDDHRKSLSISTGMDGRVLLKCHAGCSTDEILDALDLSAKDLFNNTVYEYPNGVQKIRKPDKAFLWRRPDGNGGWIYNRKGVPRSLYIAGELTGQRVFVAEGEKDANTLYLMGYNAVSGEDGAGPGKWHTEYTEQLRGLHVCVIGDNDAVGLAYAKETCNALHGVATSVRLLDLSAVWPEIPEHGDISDLIEHFGTEQGRKLIEQLIKNTPEWEPTAKPVEVRPTLESISAVDLQQKNLPPIRWIVQDLIPAGLSILASPPKFGKSWFAMDLCISVAMGKCFLDFHTNKCSCLYLALEDSEQRLKGRLNKLLDGEAAPAGVHFATVAGTIDNGLVEALEGFLCEHTDTGLIVVDTLQKIRGIGAGKDVYGRDYNDIGTLKRFADTHNAALLLIHHLRKMQDDSDPFARISGTTGISGAADTMAVLTKKKRDDDTAIMSITGRDVEQLDIVLEFDKSSCRWRNLGDADMLATQHAQKKYTENPIVKTVKTLLEQSPNGWSGTAQQLLNSGCSIVHTSLANSARALTNELMQLAEQMLEYDGIIYERKANGSGGGKHKFYYNKALKS